MEGNKFGVMEAVFEMKTNPRAMLIMAMTYFLVSLIWFFFVQNTAIGVIWLFVGIVHLIIAIYFKKGKQGK